MNPKEGLERTLDAIRLTKHIDAEKANQRWAFPNVWLHYHGTVINREDTFLMHREQTSGCST